MNLIIQQAKQYFLGREFQKARQTVEQHIDEIEKTKLPLAFDLISCSYFMQKQYQLANKFNSDAILANPRILDFYITKGAILRCLGSQNEAVQILKQTQQKVIDPAIYYNLQLLSRSNEEITVQVQSISENYRLNAEYDKWNGAVPSFLKSQSSLSDLIYQQEQEMIKYFISQISKQELRIGEIFKALKKKVEIRQLQKANHGIQFTDQGKIMIPLINKLLKIHSEIENCIQVEFYKKQLNEKLMAILPKIRQDKNIIIEIMDEPISSLAQQVIIKSKKQISAFDKVQSFQSAKKQAIFEKDFIYEGLADPGMRIAVTQTKLIIYVNPKFKRFLTPKRSIEQIRNYQLKEQKILFTFYWFICLRILFCVQEGVNINQYLCYRQALFYIYNQIQGADGLKFRTSQQFTDKTILILQKYNQLHAGTICDEAKRKIIFQNCSKFVGYLEEADFIYKSFLKNKPYVQNLCCDYNSNVIQQQAAFRQKQGIDTELEGKIAENLFILFYHFTDISQKHQVLLKTLVQISVATKKTLNGKQSFYKVYYQSVKPKQTFLKRIWNALTQ